MQFLLRSLACVGAIALPVLAQPGSTTLRFAPATATGPSAMRVTVAGTPVHVTIPPQASGTLKRDLARNALVAAGFQVVNAPPGGDTLTILNTAPGRVMVETLNSGESGDAILAPAAPAGFVGFANFLYDPWDAQAQPAVFTAGLLTDLGELSVRVDAQELGFMTHGPLICQALFQRLAPQAPAHGAAINYAGDRLEIYFDPAYTYTTGGIVFGTTSRTPGAFGAVDGPGGNHHSVIIRSGQSFRPVIDTELIELRLQSTTPIQAVPVEVQPTSPPPAVAQSVLDALRNAGLPVLPGSTPEATRVLGFDDTGWIRVELGGTAQDAVVVRGDRARHGEVGFVGLFEPFSPGSTLPAVFTAGIVTDVGELAVRISAQELNFQTEGPIICQALFQRLAPRAPDYGAAINYAGDRLEIYFDPAYTYTTGGIVFGTTSPSRGCRGTLHFTLPCRADINGDGVVDFNDLLEFLNLYNTLDPRADWNGDGVVDFNDFLEYLNDYNRGCAP